MHDAEKKQHVRFLSDSVMSNTGLHINTRLSGWAFVEADITKYGPVEEIKCSYQEAW